MNQVRVLGVAGRPVAVVGVGLLCSAGIGPAGAQGGAPGEVPGFRARNHVPDRKSIKLMSRSVQLGVSAARMALDGTKDWQSTPPERRGIFVGASAQMGDPKDLEPAFEAARGEDGSFVLARFAADGIRRIHPLWLVKGLSNNVLGFSSAAFDFQGTNSNYCDGPDGGKTALWEGAHAVAEGRADLAIAGGSESLLGAEAILGQPACGEGAAFLVFVPADTSSKTSVLDLARIWNQGPHHELGYLGAATWPVSVARAVLRLQDCDKAVTNI